MSNVVRLSEAPDVSTNVEVLLCKAVTGVIGYTAQLMRLKKELSEQFDAMDEVFSHLENGEMREALLQESALQRAKLEIEYLALEQSVRQLPALHNDLASNLRNS